MFGFCDVRMRRVAWWVRSFTAPSSLARGLGLLTLIFALFKFIIQKLCFLYINLIITIFIWLLVYNSAMHSRLWVMYGFGVVVLIVVQFCGSLWVRRPFAARQPCSDYTHIESIWSPELRSGPCFSFVHIWIPLAYASNLTLYNFALYVSPTCRVPGYVDV